MTSAGVLTKPAHGSPCNGCGFCCKAEVCGVGLAFYDVKEMAGPCPLLRFENGRYWCGVVQAEERMGLAPITKLALGVGRGCDADDYPESRAYRFDPTTLEGGNHDGQG